MLQSRRHRKHRVKQCLYLEVPIQLTRDWYHPIKDRQGKIIEPPRNVWNTSRYRWKRNKEY